MCGLPAHKLDQNLILHFSARALTAWHEKAVKPWTVVERRMGVY
jgi:hypothetical protein